MNKFVLKYILEKNVLTFCKHFLIKKKFKKCLVFFSVNHKIQIVLS